MSIGSATSIKQFINQPKVDNALPKSICDTPGTQPSAAMPSPTGATSCFEPQKPKSPVNLMPDFPGAICTPTGAPTPEARTEDPFKALLALTHGEQEPR
ncbi:MULTISPECIES: hypothetical protein [unclassified Myxococcus]|uniref:hypothetical protein n=1 Tax=unclassified Myxococcus TaxID=2648731 RepID=UPI00157A73DD|nr:MULTISPECIES: hypothetical protein [unclassified Myxococcus]NTX34744.1 hypothetical protein [Myxococcus sp. CA033]NTX51651.1 hypothetical protein [Myxococcus sp. CA039A]